MPRDIYTLSLLFFAQSLLHSSPALFHIIHLTVFGYRVSVSIFLLIPEAGGPARYNPLAHKTFLPATGSNAVSPHKRYPVLSKENVLPQLYCPYPQQNSYGEL